MKIQIINGSLTYYTKGVTLGSSLDPKPVLTHIEAIEDYCQSQRTPEQVAVEQAEEERLLAKAEEELARTREIQAYEREREARANLQEVLKMVRIDELTEEKLDKIIYYYEEFIPGESYEAGDVFHWQGKLYEVIKDHDSLPDYDPSDINYSSLYKSYMDDDVIDFWKQPQGAHDSYKLGAKVIHKDQVWVSTAENNIWEPGVHGWKLVD